MTLPVLVLLGATAVGKTALSLDVAESLNAEIINADSMQLYRGMDIGTAKVPMGERRGIPHHMLDVLDVTESANVADYQRAARSTIDDIHARGKHVVLVGGSGLFIQAVIEDLQFPGSEPSIRQRLEEDADRLGTESMYRRLHDFDPAAAANILPNNLRRIIRALEVLEITGSAPRTRLTKLPDVYQSVRVGLRRPREELATRIERRVNDMWEQGLVAEVAALETRGLRDGLTASKALGYAQVLNGLDGLCTMEQAALDTVSATRKFAKRQDSWFGRDQHISWLDAATASVDSVLDLLQS